MIRPQIFGVLEFFCNFYFIMIRYEMLYGLPPFFNENMDRMYELIRLAELKFPRKIAISNEAKDLITKVFS
jgi:serum/glucocorticoid-regulated kinase 2